MFKNKNILITGGAGFIGANLIRQLIAKQANIHLLVKKQTNLWRLKNIKDKLNLYFSDLIEENKLNNIIKKIHPEIIFHLAAHGSYPSQKELLPMIETNIKGTANLLKAVNEIEYQAFINTGSSSEYGWKDKPMCETDLLEPVSFYAATKAAATLICQVFAKMHHKPIVTLRPFSVYGPWEEPSRLVPTVISACLTDSVVKLTSKLARHDFVYVEDIVNGYLLAAIKAKNLKGEIINLGTGKQYTNQEIVEAVEKIAKKKIKVKKGSYNSRSWDTDFWVADINKARKVLGWKPRYSLEEGLKKTIDWFKKNEAHF